MSVLDFGLALSGMSEETIKELNEQLPALERLATTIKQLEPLITQAIPIVSKAWPDIVAVTPLVQSLIAFAKEKQNV